MRKLILPLIVCALLVAGLFGCDTADQNFDFHEGQSLTVTGPANITLSPDTTTADTTDRVAAHGTYYSKYSTVDKDYEWSVSGDATIDSTFRYNGLHVAISFPPTSADMTVYTVSVDNGEYQGSLDVTVTR